MKTRSIVPASVAALLIASSPAAAWDPDWEDWPSDPEPPAAAAAAVDAPDGIYLVTETYVDDVVTRSGPVTVYATETVHEITGSYARVLETVATGAGSDFDGGAFNGRAAMTDGRSVAGTYYENYIRTGDGYVAVSIVFFQDDLEVARAARASVPLTAPAAEPVLGPEPAFAAQPVPAMGSVAPVIDVADGRVGMIPEREPTAPVVVPTRPGAMPDRAIEVLRARRIAISFPDPGVVRWRFVDGEATLMGPAGGDATQPFVARWDRLPPVGGVWVTRFALAFSDGTTRDLALRVTVRAPGLVE